MYGQQLHKSLKKIDQNVDLLVVVGAEKVPGYVYGLADFNVAVGNQPHSEVAALAIFLDRYTKGDWVKKQFDGDMTIIPSDTGKKVVSKSKCMENPGYCEAIPSPEECVQLLKMSGCSDEVIWHSKVVRDVAVRIAERAGADVALVEAGALLHDIGRSKTHDISHVVVGVKLAKKLGLPERILRIIERHIGAGISVEEARRLGLPPKDYSPQTLEEKIVCHADNLVYNHQRQSIGCKVKRVLYGNHEEYARRLLQLHRELSDICGEDVNLI
jgi:tRNA (cytidine56-2'-O)-methyltransferase